MSDNYDPNNLFARLLRGEVAPVPVYEDEIALAIMDLYPQSEGHTLVLPKDMGVPDFLAMPSRAVGPFMERVHHVARGLVAALAPDGLRVQQLNGHAAGQTIFHPHVHLIPCWHGRPIHEHGAAPKTSVTALHGRAVLIRRALERIPF